MFFLVSLAHGRNLCIHLFKTYLPEHLYGLGTDSCHALKGRQPSRKWVGAEQLNRSAEMGEMSTVGGRGGEQEGL